MEPSLDLVQIGLIILGLQVTVRHHLGEVSLARRDLSGGGTVHLRETADLETASRLEQAGEVLLRHGHLTPVHVDQEQLHVLEVDILDNDYGVLARTSDEETLEVRTAHREDQLVSREVVFSARYGHIYKLFLMAQIFSKLEKALVMVFPPANIVLQKLEQNEGRLST